MRARAAFPALALIVLALAACDGRPGKTDHSNNTAVLGGYGPPVDRTAAAPPLLDAQGQAIPAPPAPAGARPQAVRSGDDSALAVYDAMLAVQLQAPHLATRYALGFVEQVSALDGGLADLNFDCV